MNDQKYAYRVTPVSSLPAAVHNNNGEVRFLTGAAGGVFQFVNGLWQKLVNLAGGTFAWDDLRIEPVARTTGANAPSFEKYFDNGAGSNGVFLYSFDDAVAGSEKQIFFTMQMPHDWNLGGIHIHVHWIGNISQVAADPLWGLEFNWKKIGSVFGNTGLIYVATHVGPIGTPVADIVANTHYVSEFAVQNPDATQNTVSSILIGRLFRDSANAADTYTSGGNKCGLLYIDAHYQKSSLGTATEGA